MYVLHQYCDAGFSLAWFLSLLSDRPDQVRQHLDEYLQRSMMVIKGHDMDQELCLLCIQCFEVCLLVMCVYIMIIIYYIYIYIYIYIYKYNNYYYI